MHGSLAVEIERHGHWHINRLLSRGCVQSTSRASECWLIDPAALRLRPSMAFFDCRCGRRPSCSGGTSCARLWGWTPSRCGSWSSTQAASSSAAQVDSQISWRGLYTAALQKRAASLNLAQVQLLALHAGGIIRRSLGVGSLACVCVAPGQIRAGPKYRCRMNSCLPACASAACQVLRHWAVACCAWRMPQCCLADTLCRLRVWHRADDMSCASRLPAATIARHLSEGQSCGQHIHSQVSQQ